VYDNGSRRVEKEEEEPSDITVVSNVTIEEITPENYLSPITKKVLKEKYQQSLAEFEIIVRQLLKNIDN
jgi:hypothetical protein